MKKILLTILISISLIILVGIYVLSGIISPQWWLQKYGPRISALGDKYPEDVEIQEGLFFLYGPHQLEDIKYSRDKQCEKLLSIDPNSRIAWAQKAKRACCKYSSDYLHLSEHLARIIANAKKEGVERLNIGSYSPTLKKFYDRLGIEYIEKEQFDDALEQMRLEFNRRMDIPLEIIDKAQNINPENAIYNYYKAHIYLLLGRHEDALKEIEKGVSKKYLRTYQNQTRRAAKKVLAKVWFPPPHGYFVTSSNWPFEDFIGSYIWRGNEHNQGFKWQGLSQIAEEYEKKGNFEMAEKIYDLTIAMVKQAQPEQKSPTVLDKTAQKHLEQLHQKMQRD